MWKINKLKIVTLSLSDCGHTVKMVKLNIAIIGAGMAGLASAKYAKSSGHLVTIFEQCAELGGTWIYREETGRDEYGLNIHTSMYHNLR